MKKEKPSREELATLCLQIADHYRKTSQLEGSQLAHLASALVAAESQPGGPYFGPQGTIDFPTNLAIGYLFSSLKKPLPNVARHIEQHRHHAPLSSLALLKRYDNLVRPPEKQTPKNPQHQAIFAQAKRTFSLLQQPEKKRALAFLKKLHMADTNFEIALIPTFLHNSLISPPASAPLCQLGEANIHSWVAYSIYDKLLDDEPVTELLPIANIAMRKSVALYQSVFSPAHPFQEEIQNTFTGIDHANAWEIANCRANRVGDSITIPALPKYRNNQFLAMRSLAHVLGPLALASLANSPIASIATFKKGLQHYLIARQLSDDVHDWKEDFSAGHLSSAVTLLLTHLSIRPGEYSYKKLHSGMQQIFWKGGMEALNTLIYKHLRLSRRYLHKSHLIKNNGELFVLHQRLEAVVNTSTKELRQYQAFLTNYQPLHGK